MNMKKPDDLQVIANHPFFQFRASFFLSPFLFEDKSNAF